MSLFKIQRCARCIISRGISSINKHQNKKFSTFLPSYSKGESNIERLTIQNASKLLSNTLGTCKSGFIFTGTGQYFQFEDQDRILVVNLGENFLSVTNDSLLERKVLLDCCLKHSDVDSLIEDVKSCSTLPVFNGEVDFINSSSWQYGFTVKPFSIFSVVERICLISGSTVYTSVDGHSEVTNVNDIDYVGLWVSHEPYNECKLLFGMKDQQTRTLIHIDTNNVNCDMAKLTEDTEWMMKAAALLCLELRRHGNGSVRLKVSPALQPGNNQWVAMRQKIWLEMIQKNTSREKDDND